MSCGVTAVNRSAVLVTDPCRERNQRLVHRSKRIFRGRLADAAICLRSGGGPRRPNAARALWKESLLIDRPSAKPARPFFSSGPCAKPPGWAPGLLRTDALGRSHRGTIGKARLEEAIERTRALLQLPPDHRLAIV